MNALVETAGGVHTVDVDADALVSFVPGAELEPAATPVTGLPRVVAGSAAGSTILLAVDAKPPLVVSHDAGATWRESGRGLPKGDVVAVSPDDPDRMLFCAGGRLYVSRDGGRFWTPLATELGEPALAAAWV